MKSAPAKNAIKRLHEIFKSVPADKFRGVLWSQRVIEMAEDDEQFRNEITPHDDAHTQLAPQSIFEAIVSSSFDVDKWRF